MRGSILPMVTAIAAAACGECTWCAGSAEVVHEESGRTVSLSAQGFRDFEVGGIGAPHAFGILYPEIQGSGYRLYMTVDDRPVVDVARVASGHVPSSDELDGVLEGIEVRVASRGDHVALRFEERWHVFHLLSAGTPFDLPGSVAPGPELDLDAQPSAEEAGLAFLADASAPHDAHPLFWAALEAVPAGPPWDEAVLGPWPGSERAHDHVIARLGRSPAPAPAFRAAFDREARPIVERDADAERGADIERERAVAALIAIGGDSLDWLDARAVTTFGDLTAGITARREAKTYLERRLRLDDRDEVVGATPPPDAANPSLVAAARGVIEDRRPSRHADVHYERRTGVVVSGATDNDDFIARNWDLRLALRIVEARGAQGDRAWADAIVLEEWPAVDWTSLDETLVRRIAAHPDDEELRRQVTERAARGIREDPDVRGIAGVLFVFGRSDTDDQALRALLAHFDAEHLGPLEAHLARASPAFERDAAAEARRIVAATEPLESADEPARLRARDAVHLLMAIEGEDGDCEKLGALGELESRTHTSGRRMLPERCRQRPPAGSGAGSGSGSGAGSGSGSSLFDD